MKRKIRSRVLMALAAAGALLFALLGPWNAGASQTDAAAVTASQDACHTVNNNMPKGNCGKFVQVYADNFNGGNVPVGAFSSCAGDGDFRCAGLKTKYPAYYTTMGAYPSGWPDTANPSNHSNGNSRRMGGEYRPEDTMSVVKNGTDGVMRVRMWHQGGGTSSSPAGLNHVAAPVPLKCMNLRYGKFSERWKVSGTLNGYKMAHLRYAGSEIDYPEAGGNFAGDPVSAFVHGFREYGTNGPGSWTAAHTSTYEITPSGVTFYLDGKKIGSVSGNNPDTTAWVLQNESSLAGGYAAAGTSVTLDTTWISCYRLAS
jgi:hypothetical protein